MNSSVFSRLLESSCPCNQSARRCISVKRASQLCSSFRLDASRSRYCKRSFCHCRRSSLRPCNCSRTCLSSFSSCSTKAEATPLLLVPVVLVSRRRELLRRCFRICSTSLAVSPIRPSFFFSISRRLIQLSKAARLIPSCSAASESVSIV